MVPPGPGLSRRELLVGAGAGALALGAGHWPGAPAPAGWCTLHRAGEIEVTVASDGRFTLPMDYLVGADAPPAERAAALAAAGQGGERFQLVSNVTLLRTSTEVILVDCGYGRHGPDTAGKLVGNLAAAGVDPGSVTKLVFTHGHPGKGLVERQAGAYRFMAVD